MNSHQAGDIAVKIAQTWRSTTANDIWEEELAPLDFARAEEAYRNLRREARHAPTIADFLGAYRMLLGTIDAGEIECSECGDSGWITCTEHPRHRGHWDGRENKRPVHVNSERQPDPSECECNIARPCRCAAGKAAEAGWRRHRSVA